MNKNLSGYGRTFIDKTTSSQHTEIITTTYCMEVDKTLYYRKSLDELADCAKAIQAPCTQLTIRLDFTPAVSCRAVSVLLWGLQKLLSYQGQIERCTVSLEMEQHGTTVTIAPNRSNKARFSGAWSSGITM